MTNQTLFGVYILKKDQNLLTILQTENFDEAKRQWQSSVDRWTKCIADKRPFIIDTGVSASAFDPGLIHEVFIKPIELTNRINPNNPFMQQMQAQGFSNTFGQYTNQRPNNFGPTEELLDRGYTF